MGELIGGVSCHECPFRQNFTCSILQPESLCAVREQHILEDGAVLPASADEWGVSYILLAGAVSMDAAAIRANDTEPGDRVINPGEGILCLKGKCNVKAIAPSIICQIDLSKVVALEKSEVMYRKIVNAYCAHFGVPTC